MGKAKPTHREHSDLRLLYAAILVAVLLRLYRLSEQPIWGDEALTLLHYTAGNSLAEMWRRIWTSGGHPPFYFMTVFYWYKLGHSEFMLRFPSVVYGVTSIPVVYALVNRLYAHRTAALAAWIVAISPIHIWYSQEARMYTLQILLALTSTLFLLKAWQEHRFRDHVLFVIFAILGLFTHMATVLFVLGQAAFVLIAHARNPRILAAWMALFVLIGLAFAPWALAFVKDNTSDGGSLGVGYERHPTMFDTPYAFYTLTVGYSMGPSTADLHQADAVKSLSQHRLEIITPVIVFGTLAILGLRRTRRLNGEALLLMAAMLIVPTVLASAGSHLPGFPLNPRYILLMVIPYWVVLALGVDECLHKRYLAVIPAAALFATLFSLHNYYFTPRYMKQDMRSATGLVNQQARKGDVVIISSVELGGPFIYYFHRRDVPYFGYPHDGGFVDAAQLDPDMQRLTVHSNRVWLVLGRTWSSDPNGLITRYFDRTARETERRRYQGITVVCYDLPHRACRATNR